MHPPEEPLPATRGELVVVTGMTGAGRSTAAKELEDLGFYVVDNLPPSLLSDVVSMVDENRGYEQPIAVVIDVRSGSFFGALRANLAQGAIGRRTTLLFLEATDDVLVRRQEAARRPHPLQAGGRLLDGLLRERIALADLRSEADVVIDTTNLNVHQLRDRIVDLFANESPRVGMQTRVMSFGYKHGLPIDVDIVIDCRFLPNPHWVDELRPKTGRDDAVVAYVMSQASTAPFLDRLERLLSLVMPQFVQEGKSYLTVAFGCTGGHHRSVVIAEQVAAMLRRLGYDPTVSHRDIDN